MRAWSLTTSQNIKEGIEGRPASWYSEIFDLIFPSLDHEKANIDKASQYKGPDSKEAENKNKDKDSSEKGDESD